MSNHESSHLSDPSTSLRRTLGLYAVLTISVGAMIGSGIFVLPGLAFKIAGPSVILAFFLAGLVVLPAAISQSEMATAMPEAGGTYLYIDRAMGPLMGTIAGFGVWFSLVFKASFALVGLSAYLEFFVEHPERPLAAVLAILLVALNLRGLHQTAKLQSILVTIVLALLAAFIIFGMPNTQPERFEPFLSEGLQGLFSATAVVFVSYIGVTKVASVAEEVKRPGRNIPLSILTSVGIALVLYPAVVAVMVGVTPAAELAGTETPILTAAAQFLGTYGQYIVAGVAVLALLSMANAGVIASARYPFAMARNSLAPPFLAKIGKKSGAPVAGITVTGIALILLVLFVPLIELAKLASAFQLLVFALVNLALIAFRESHLDWYKPEFRSPFYPAPQVFGIVASLLLLTQMGIVPLVGAIVLVFAGVGWYRVFGKSRAVKESAARDALRLRENARLVQNSRDAVTTGGRKHVLVLIRRPTRPSRQQTLFRLALRLTDADGGRIHVINFDARTRGMIPTEADLARAEELGITVTTQQYTDEDRRGMVHLFVEREGVDLFIADLPQDVRATRHVTRDLRWLRENLVCDSVFLRNRSVEDIDRIAILGTGGPYDPVKIGIADHIARYEDASVRFVHVTPVDAPPALAESIHEYHEQLGEILTVPWDDRVRPADDLVKTLTRFSRGANLVILGAPSHRFHVVTDLADRIAESLDCPVLLVHTPTLERPGLLTRGIQWLIN
ncbi:MAG: amino acid transporter [Acidobacteria bacterium]|nr:MAG: amino acid transporter [Acidobacteriota bacterium]